ncbi:MAG: GIY-YIG nuclease family protein [Gemmatimonadetes bacterium]|nr:GIY-YIG nuclease family protein [Gemmatimonadota bacterium]
MPALAFAPAPAAPPTLEALRAHVRAAAARRPGVYEFLDEAGRVFYVGKAKDLRSRVLSYFSAPWPESKSALLIRSAADISWRYLPSEFAALLEELRLIGRLRPAYNVRGNLSRARLVFLKLTMGAAPKLRVTDHTRDRSARYYGPFRGREMAVQAVRTLSDLLGLRDCADAQPIVYGDQAGLFDVVLTPACYRHDLGTCLGPCAARCSADAYRAAALRAADFLEGRSAHPLDKVLDAMADASAECAYERAAAWRDRLDSLEWLFGAVARLRAAVEGLSFVYGVKDRAGGSDDRVYLIRHGVVRAEAAWPRTPIEQAAFAGEVRRHTRESEPAPAARSGAEMDQLMLVMSWFRQHPQEFEAASPYDRWMAPD